MRWVTVAPPGSVTEIALLAPSEQGPPDSRNGYTGITFTSHDIDSAYPGLERKRGSFHGTSADDAVGTKSDLVHRSGWQYVFPR